MRIQRVEIENFRLLREVSVGLEERTTLIVGRNNSGKTSIAELFRRLLTDSAPSFRLEDFSLGCHERFWSALEAHRAGADAVEVLALLPVIKVTIDIGYDVAAQDLGVLGDCIIDLDPACTTARIIMSYAPKPSAVEQLLASAAPAEAAGIAPRLDFFRALANSLTHAYSAVLEAVDPGDPTNRKTLEQKTLGALIHGGFINAQRGLDDDTRRDKDVLGKIVEVLFQSALNDTVDPERRSTAEQLQAAVADIQTGLHTDFNDRLTTLLPTFDLFGYPGMGDPGLVTETNFDIGKLLSDHTKVRYLGLNGVTLPEVYNGLGMRNLVYILLQLLRFFREHQARPTSAGVHLIFIEEPEAHLHPQMQEVFIRKLDQIATEFSTRLNEGRPWPVQFVVSTHSPHMANEAHFEAMRYFLSVPDGQGLRRSVIKDLRQGPGAPSAPDREFLHQYLTLTRCDLFFADKAVLIEGTSERLLLPAMIRKTDAADPTAPQLSSQYVTVMEVGGAYANKFFDLLDFLELRTLVITDIDAVAPNANGKMVAVPVAQGTATSNGCVKAWFENTVTPSQLIAKTDADRIKGRRRLAYQIPEVEGGPSARSFEDAFILANPDRFPLGGGDAAALAYALAGEQKKSAFALEHAIEHQAWTTPRYIAEGLRWLAEGDPATSLPPSDAAIDIAAGLVEAAAAVVEDNHG